MDDETRWIPFLLLALSIASSAFAEEKLPEPFFAPRPDFYDGAQPLQRPPDPNLFRLIGRDFKNLVTTKESLPILGTGLGAAWGATHWDNHVVTSAFNSELSSGTTLDRAFEAGEYAGDGYVQIGVALSAYGFGKLLGDPGTQELGRDLFRAQLMAGVITHGLKVAVGRQRPDSPGRSSFPSGHTSSAFATASVVQRHFGWGAGVPAYALAGYVAGARLSESRHYLSDVIFGAAIGIVSGRTVTLGLASERFAIGPMLVPGGGVGIQLTWLGEPDPAR